MEKIILSINIIKDSRVVESIEDFDVNAMTNLMKPIVEKMKNEKTKDKFEIIKKWPLNFLINGDHMDRCHFICQVNQLGKKLEIEKFVNLDDVGNSKIFVYRKRLKISTLMP
jgi:hypothetical protein